MERIESPAAEASVLWYTENEGGRKERKIEVLPGWSATEDHLSILLEATEKLDDGRMLCNVGFLALDLLGDRVRVGVELLVMEGPRAVALATIDRILDGECAR